MQESNYAKEAVQADSSFETNFAIEFARHTGIALAPAIALGFYLLTNTLPETMFLIAIPFMIPGAMYALKKV